MRITVRNTSRIPELVRDLKQLDKSEIKVGVFSADDSEMVMIAAVHEYGTEITVTDKMRGWFGANGFPLKKDTTKIVIPERSYLRSTFDENVDDIARHVEMLLPDVLENKTDPDVFMDMIGLQFAGLIQKKLIRLRSPANSGMTVERKGSSNPLVDSGRLLSSVRHAVE